MLMLFVFILLFNKPYGSCSYDLYSFYYLKDSPKKEKEKSKDEKDEKKTGDKDESAVVKKEAEAKKEEKMEVDTPSKDEVGNPLSC